MARIPEIINERIEYYSKKLEGNQKLQKLYKNGFLSTWETTLEKCEDGTYFVKTGDIPAMWLRDSAAQVTHYIPLADNKEVSEGMGNPVEYTGMAWSGFRPSDDGCQYGYMTASEMFSVVVLKYMEEMLRVVCMNEDLAKKCNDLREQIDAGIKEYSIIKHPKHGEIYVYETDGMGN